MVRLYGRAPRGQRVYDCAPHGHWHTTTMIGSVRLDGSTACMTLEGAMDAEAFLCYVRSVLVPTLVPGDIVVMDNLRAHKSVAALSLIESVGARVEFLPAYSPDLNPIEQMWSKVKALLRGFAARTFEQLLDAIAVALQCVTSQDAAGWFSHCGYNII